MKKIMSRIVSVLIAMVICVTSLGDSTAFAASSKKSKSVKVTSQKALNNQLKKKNGSKLIYTNKKTGKVTVKKGSYKRQIVFNAAKTSVTNSGVFTGITVNGIKKFTEKGSGNSLTFLNKKFDLVIAKQSKKDIIKLNKKDIKANITINGSVKSITAAKKTVLTISGTPKSAVKVNISGKGSKVTANVKGKIALNITAGCSVVIGKKVKGGTIKVKDTANVSITNKSSHSITVTDYKGNKITVKKGTKATLKKGLAKKNFAVKAQKIKQSVSIDDPDVLKDTDNDGLSDYDEKQLGTDINAKDTDGDGLDDYQEAKILFYDPLKADTDGDGIPDASEDYDGDGICDGDEIAIETSPILQDTDNDGLNDYIEINQYGTDPLKADTDEDGTSDGDEVNNGFDPIKKNESFEVQTDTGEVSAENPMAVSVAVTASDADISSLKITPVGVSDNCFISPSVAGYLGEAQNFSIDGKIKEATISIDYDKSVGELNDTFQPRIYYFNESNGSFEELPDQKVEEGKITAEVQKTGTYILLNKVEVDKVWSKSIRVNSGNKNGKNSNADDPLDVVFVIDYSESMDQNDPNGIRKEVVKSFINKLNVKTDRAAVVKFAAYATVLVPLTDDKEMLTNAVDQIVNNSGSSCDGEAGTNGSDGINSALELLEASAAKNRYVVFLTDGADTTSSYEYSELVARAKEASIPVFTVGMGDCDTVLLENIADGTGGTYFYASTAESVEDSDFGELGDIMNDIENETIDMVTDTNGDGISDYYTSLIKRGKLLLSNGSDEFYGIDFNYDKNGKLSDDYDCDGLKNSEEIRIITDESTGRVWICMSSNPLLSNSDYDDMDDLYEVAWGSDPLRYSIDDSLADILISNAYYYSESAADGFYDDVLYKAATVTGSFIFGVWDKDQLYSSIMSDFYADYIDDAMYQYFELLETKKESRNVISGLLANTRDCVEKFETVKDYTDTVKSLYTIIDGINSAKTIEEIDKDFFNMLSTVCVNLHNVSEEATLIRRESHGLSYVTNIVTDKTSQAGVFKKLDDISGKVDTVLAVVDFALDAGDTISDFAKIRANFDCIESQMEILDHIIMFSDDKHARVAAAFVESALANECGYLILQLEDEAAQAGVEYLIDFCATQFVPVAIAKAIIDITGLVTGVGDDIEEQYELLCYHELNGAYADVLKNKYLLVHDNGYYEVKNEQAASVGKYFTYLVQGRILAEKKYTEYMEFGGLCGLIFNNGNLVTNAKSNANQVVKLVKNVAESLGFPVSTKLPSI